MLLRKEAQIQIQFKSISPRFLLLRKLNPLSENNASLKVILRAFLWFSFVSKPPKKLLRLSKEISLGQKHRQLLGRKKSNGCEGFLLLFNEQNSIRQVFFGIRALSINGFCSYLNALAVLGRLISCKSCLLPSVLLCKARYPLSI